MEVKDTYVADVSRYSGPLREAAGEADRFGNKNDQAALAARKMGLAAKEAADKAARAQKDAADAAEQLARGEIKVDEAARAAARAENELERASIKAAEANRAAGRAAENAAQQYRQEARDAELAGAAQKLATLKASGAVKEHNAEIQRLKARFGDLSKEGNGAFKEIEQSGNKAFSAIGSIGPAKLALVAAGILALPFAAIGVEAAITLGIGGALGGLGLAATKSDKDVQAALQGMTSHIKSETKSMAAPFKDTWLQIAAEGRKTFDALAPQIQKSFAVMAPAITRFAHDAGYAITLLGPAFGAATAGADKLMAALGPKLPEITRSLGSAITIMAKSAGDNAGEFANLASSIAGLLPPIAHLLDYTVKIGPYMSPLFGMMAKGGASVSALHDGVVKLSGGLISSQHGLQIVEQTFPTFEQKATLAAVGAHQLMTAQQAAALTSDQLKNALTSLTGATQGAFDAETSYRQALVAANAQAKSNNAGINGMGKSALANRQALSSLAGAIKTVETSGHHTAAQIDAMRSNFISAARGMGVSRSAAIDLANKLLGVKSAANSIPGSKNVKLNNNAAAAAAQIRAYQRWINSLHGKTVNIHTVYTSSIFAPQSANQPGSTRHALGGIIHRANGGPVRFGDGGPSGMVVGPGTGTSDSIPALLSDGEFVVNAKQTAKWLPVLESINAGVEGFAKGGMGIGKMEQKQIARLHAAQARVTHAKARPEYLAAMAAQQALASMRSSVYGGIFRGGRSTPGSAHGSVVQHTTNLNVTVQGNVWQTTQLAQELQSVILRSGMPLTLPAGR